MTFEDFVEILHQANQLGYVSEPVCVTHDGIPWQAHEQAMWEDGQDPCAVVFRVWDRPPPENN